MTTLERMARAIAQARGVDPESVVTRQMLWTTPDGYTVLPPDLELFGARPAWTEYWRAALEALKAIREPSDRTTLAMVKELGVADFDETDAEIVFRAAIDSILSEAETSK